MSLLDVRLQPDVDALLKCIRRQGRCERVHHIELFLDEEVKQQLCRRFGIAAADDSAGPTDVVRRDAQLHRFLGYDVFRVDLAEGLLWQLPWLRIADTTQEAAQRRGQREWIDEHAGPVRSRADFERFPWPTVRQVDFSKLEWLEKNLPPDMGCYELTAHILENVSWLLGLETLCYKMFDEPELVDAVCEKVGSYYVEFTEALCDFDCIKVIWGSDDMGFRTGTLLSPEFLRQNILPWHKRCAQIAHERGRPYLLHSCGNLDQIMPDLIEDVAIDAKHSFEDTIMPVTEARRIYTGRLSLLGGIDVDFLCRSDEQSIRRRVRQTLTECMDTSGYCLGTGNTVTNYMPLESYLVMLDEGRRFALA